MKGKFLILLVLAALLSPMFVQAAFNLEDNALVGFLFEDFHKPSPLGHDEDISLFEVIATAILLGLIFEGLIKKSTRLSGIFEGNQARVVSVTLAAISIFGLPVTTWIWSLLGIFGSVVGIIVIFLAILFIWWAFTRTGSWFGDVTEQGLKDYSDRLQKAADRIPLQKEARRSIRKEKRKHKIETAREKRISDGEHKQWESDDIVPAAATAYFRRVESRTHHLHVPRGKSSYLEYVDPMHQVLNLFPTGDMVKYFHRRGGDLTPVGKDCITTAEKKLRAIIDSFNANRGTSEEYEALGFAVHEFNQAKASRMVNPTKEAAIDKHIKNAQAQLNEMDKRMNMLAKYAWQELRTIEATRGQENIDSVVATTRQEMRNLERDLVKEHETFVQIINQIGKAIPKIDPHKGTERAKQNIHSLDLPTPMDLPSAVNLFTQIIQEIEDGTDPLDPHIHVPEGTELAREVHTKLDEIISQLQHGKEATLLTSGVTRIQADYPHSDPATNGVTASRNGFEQVERTLIQTGQTIVQITQEIYVDPAKRTELAKWKTHIESARRLDVEALMQGVEVNALIDEIAHDLNDNPLPEGGGSTDSFDMRAGRQPGYKLAWNPVKMGTGAAGVAGTADFSSMVNEAGITRLKSELANAKNLSDMAEFTTWASHLP